MPHSKYHKVALLVALTFLLSHPTAKCAELADADDRSPDALEARLKDAEQSFLDGKLQAAIDKANALVNVTDSSFFQSDSVARDAKADLAVFQLKAGQADQSAKLMRELLLTMQLELILDPKFQSDPAMVLAGAPAILKTQFATVIERLHEEPETKKIIELLIDNTYPKDYLGQLKPYCAHVKAGLAQLSPFQSVASSEELKYGDPLTSLENDDDDKDLPPELNAAKLEKIGENLDALARQAWEMPVGDASGALGLYTAALLANHLKKYQMAEDFAEHSIRYIKNYSSRISSTKQMQIALAYAYLKQSKNDSFDGVKEELLKSAGGEERLLITLARFSQLKGDNSGAAAIYKRALDNREKKGDTSKPEWLDCYSQLSKDLGQESPH